MESFLVRRGLLVLGLIAWLGAPAVSQAEITLYQSSAVVMETLWAESGAVNDQPLDAADELALARLFASLRVRSDATGERHPLMGEGGAKELAAQLAKALNRVEAGQDIHLSVFRSAGGFGSPRRHGTGIRVFVKDGGLHLIFGQVDVFLDEFREPYAKRPAPGSRLVSKMAGGAVEAEPWLTQVAGRADWVSYAVASKGGGLRIEEGQAPAALAAQPHGATTRATAPIAPAPLAPSGNRWTDLEQGLETLERLKAKGLISAAEYREKRARLMAEAGL